MTNFANTALSCIAFTLAMVLALPRPAAGQDSPPVSSLRIPVFTAYSEPKADGLQLEEVKSVLSWRSADDQIVWYGELRAGGQLYVSLSLQLPPKQAVTLRLRLAGQSREVRIEGSEGAIIADFGAFAIAGADYQRFELTGVSKTGDTFGRIEALNLSGPAAAGAQFNLKPRRNAASVHLGYPTDAKDVAWFYNELTVREDPVNSFYMACGFRRGYFGIQVNSPTERRIIFSVWDAGSEAKDRGKVKDTDRVKLLGKGEKVVASDFGNEGTGGHSHLVYDWKPGQTYRFLLAAEPDGDATVYSAYFYFPEKAAWGMIASFRAPKDGNYLSGLHSFNENFWGTNGQMQRLAEYGPPWIRTAAGGWKELTGAKFTHDATGKADRFDYGAGIVNGHFYLSNGGFTRTPIRGGGEDAAPKATKYGDVIDCPPRGKAPDDIRLP